jgi:hypothetical protein
MLIHEIIKLAQEQGIDAVSDDELRNAGSYLGDAEWNSRDAERLGLKSGWFETQRALVRRQKALPKIARPQAAQPTVRMVWCDCGHRIPANLMMSSSRGTCCPDCYDRMSN